MNRSEELNQLLWGGEFALEVPHVERRYNRDKLRLTDADGRISSRWPGKPGGGKRRVAIREVINA